MKNCHLVIPKDTWSLFLESIKPPSAFAPTAVTHGCSHSMFTTTQLESPLTKLNMKTSLAPLRSILWFLSKVRLSTKFAFAYVPKPLSNIRTAFILTALRWNRSPSNQGLPSHWQRRILAVGISLDPTVCCTPPKMQSKNTGQLDAHSTFGSWATWSASATTFDH